MLDVRTLFVVMIVTCLLLAASMTAAVGMQFRDGVGKWTGSLLLQATMFILLMLRGVLPDGVVIVAPSAMVMVSLTLQGAAILEFHQKPMSIWWHAIPAGLILVLFSLMQDNHAARIIVSGVLLGTAMLWLGLLLQRLHTGTTSPARWIVIVGFIVGSFDLYARVTVVIIDPAAIRSTLQPGVFQGINFLIAYAVILTTSLGFLLLQKERAEESAQKLAVTDPLTGTFNRRTFLELADKEISRAQRAGTALSLVMLDLDHFKRVNDEYGHPAGDEVLKRAVTILQASLRREDLLVRYGGEEFCILLPNVALDHATLMAERARDAIQHGSFQYKGRIIPITISLGVASMLDKGDTTAMLIARADEALYSAKRAGRNRVVAFPENSTFAMLMRSQRT